MLNWMLRPQLLSYFFCVCTVFVLCVAFRGQEGNFCILARSGSQNPRLPTPLTQSKYWLGLLPVVMVLWTNAHGGFLAGLAIVGAYLGLRCFELYWLRPEGYIRDIRFLCIIGIATASASLINPYGWSLHLWLLESLGTPRPEIVEWRGIDLARPKAWNYCLLIGGTAGAYLFSKRRVDLTHFVILVLVGWQAILHRRHVPFYVILFAFWLMPHIDSFLSDRRRPSIVVPTWLQRATVALALLAAGYFGTQWMTRVQHLPVHRFQFPVQALRFMKAQGLHTEGRIVVMYGWAQYVLGAFGARTADDVGLRLACDGRFRTCYPQEVLDQLLDFELGGQMRRERSPRSGPIDGSRILREGNPDLVLVNRLQSHAVYIMEKNQSQWTLIYQDQIAELWGRSSIYDNPDHERYVPRIDRLKLTTQDLSSAQWPAYP